MSRRERRVDEGRPRQKPMIRERFKKKACCEEEEWKREELAKEKSLVVFESPFTLL